LVAVQNSLVSGQLQLWNIYAEGFDDMGTYLNPGNIGFKEKTRSDYVDKTDLIEFINKSICTNDKLTCVSRPRRFGKSFDAQMLCAYYDKSCDSKELFDGYAISGAEDYEEHLNGYHVISLDISGFISEAKKNKTSISDLPVMIDRAIKDEVTELYGNLKKAATLNEYLLEMVRQTRAKIVFVIDEWDSLIREAKNNIEAQERYLNLLRGWFKNNNFTPEAVAAAYMTGILPIKKDGSQSAISDFREYSMLYPGKFAGFAGFTEDEVRLLCKKKGGSFSGIKEWYDGYRVGNSRSMYNPYSVMQALESGKYTSYWKKTAAAETLMTYVDMDMNGLQQDLARLLAGERVEVDTDSFENDVESFRCKDDVLTLLIHLGYLTYEEEPDFPEEPDSGYTGFARIPNEEVRGEFEKILRKAGHRELLELVKKSDRLLKNTIEGNSDAVAEAVQEIHDLECAPTFYNDEQSLRYVVKLAYITCLDQYLKIEELPSGHGIADVVFIPKKKTNLPAIVVELKWNKSAEGAISQIKERGYGKILRNYGGEVILVGINYDEKTKIHTCVIDSPVC